MTVDNGKLLIAVASLAQISVYGAGTAPAVEDGNEDKSKKEEIARKVESYLRGLRFMRAKFEQITGDGGELYQGKFWLSKLKTTKIRVSYTSGLAQEILVIGDSVTVYESKTGKQYRYSLSSVPVYSVIVGKIDLCKEKFSILEDSKELLRIRLERSSIFNNIAITLVFSKYEKSGNIEYLRAWIIDDEKTETLFSLDPETLSINDARKAPESVFEIPASLTNPPKNLKK
ncbi:MAG: hypothetical protein LBF56_00165 [Holosporales bacterium]|jgi:outer membrane lipoprotein-sorting protein|nr:hypothetical protein [Holosporales bacterium]